MIEEISPRSVFLKIFLKWPMVLLVWSCGTWAGQNLCFFKAFGEILSAGDFFNRPIMAISIASIGCIGALIQIFILNISMRYYNNLDIMPVYQSLILIMMLVSGWTLLDEIEYYEFGNLMGILGASVLIVAGIKFVTMKTSVVTTLKKRKNSIQNELNLDTIHLAQEPDLQGSPGGGNENESNISFDKDSYRNLSVSDMSGATADDKKERMREAHLAQIVKVMLGREKANPVLKARRNSINISRSNDKRLSDYSPRIE